MPPAAFLRHLLAVIVNDALIDAILDDDKFDARLESDASPEV
jgi:hypothetical protein